MRVWVTLLTCLLLLSACGKPDKPSISLYLAVQRADIDQVKRHLFWGTDINQTFPDGRTPLHDAASQGRIILVRLLLENSADLEALDKEQRTPIQLALLGGRTQTAQELLDAGAQLDASAMLLDIARASLTDRDVVRFLKTHGANFNTQDEQGDSALMIATRLGDHRLVHHLVEQGADVNLTNAQGLTALDIARNLQSIEVERYLLRNGAISGR